MRRIGDHLLAVLFVRVYFQDIMQHIQLILAFFYKNRSEKLMKTMRLAQTPDKMKHCTNKPMRF